MRALDGFERDGRAMEQGGKSQPTTGEGRKQTETERNGKCAEAADDNPNSRRRFLLPINEALALICHLDCTSELVRRRGRKKRQRGFGYTDIAELWRGREKPGGGQWQPPLPSLEWEEDDGKCL